MGDYSSRQLTIAWGPVLLTGFVPDDFATFQRVEDITSSVVGADGFIATSVSPNESGTAALSFMHGSAGDKILTGALAEQATKKQIARHDLQISDPNGSVFIEMVGAHIQAAPEWSFGSTSGDKTRVYTFFVDNFKFLAAPVGTNEAVQDNIIANISALFNINLAA